MVLTKLGKYIEPSDLRNSDGAIGETTVVGLSTQKQIISTKASLIGVNLTSYKLFPPKHFAYVPDTSRRGDKMSLGYNSTEDTFLVSSISVVFRISDTDGLLPDYLYMYFNRPEFDRYARFNSWGSAREAFSWGDMCDIDIELPPLPIQQKYVDVYNAMLANQRAYESGLEDLKLTCDAYIDRLRHELPHEAIGRYVEQSDARNNIGLQVESVRGLAVSKEMIATKYQFELSEEYLPDVYLHEIYAPKIIERIDAEINNAIRKYVQAGCDALGIKAPDDPDMEFISSLITRLDAETSKYDDREAVLKQEPEYLEKRAQYEQLQKLLDTAQKNQTRAVSEAERIHEDQKVFSDLLQNLQETENERTAWVKQREERIISARNELARIAIEMEEYPTASVPAHYAHQLCVLRSLTGGDTNAADKDYLAFLNDYCNEAKNALQAVTKKQKPETYAEKLKERVQENSKKQNALASEIDDLSRKVEDCAEWLRMKASEMEGAKSQITLQRSELEKSKYFLSRIESIVFESEVWNVLAPIKEKHGIKTIQVDSQEKGHQRETRILYKSDLLFYVKIYAQIHSNKGLPYYQIICIDEGQDLHNADFDVLHTLFPAAVFNVFGDLAQVLHTSCGIDDWQKGTGIQQIYKLDRNYRNTAAIVDYCNTSLGSNMQYIGKVHTKQKPQVFSDVSTLKSVAAISGIVTIVKDNKSFQNLCTAIGKSSDEFEYLDTKAEQPTGAKPACYSIFAAKGLEFSTVLVYSPSMNLNQKVVACTRAMERLCYYE